MSYTVCGDGTAPYTTLQDAVDDASDGDVITVCPGVYGAVYVGRHDLTLQGAGPDTTTIYSTTGPALDIEDVNVDVSGFSVGGVGSSSTPGAILVTDATVSLHNLSLSDNSTQIVAEQSGGDVAWEDVTFDSNSFPIDSSEASFLLNITSGKAEIYHCIFADNQSLAVFKGDESMVDLHNNLFLKNSGNYLAVFAGSSSYGYSFFNNVVYGNVLPSSTYSILLNGGADIRNNIIASNSGGSALTYRPDYTEYNLVWDNDAGTSLDGTGNVASDPKFTDATGGDFSLMAIYSPAVDAGDPATKYDDVDGTRDDMGAYGGPYGEWD